MVVVATLFSGEDFLGKERFAFWNRYLSATYKIKLKTIFEQSQKQSWEKTHFSP